MSSGVQVAMEVLDLTPPLHDIFATIRAAALDWDGANPVRELRVTASP